MLFRSEACSCNGGTTEGSQNLGPVSTYGYIPCTECYSIRTDIKPITGIWWSKNLDTENGSTATNTPNIINGSTSVPGPDNSCANVFNNLGNAQCQCSKLYKENTNLPSTNPLYYEIDTDKLKECVGFTDIQEFLDDPCMRSQYLPAGFKD